MGDSKIDNTYKEVPFIFKHSSNQVGSADTSCTAICDSLDNGAYESKNDTNHDTHEGLINENPIFGINFNSQIDYKDVYTPNSINSFNTDFENNNRIVDYQINQPIHYFNNGINEYNNTNLGDASNDVGDENKLNYNGNTDVQKELNTDHNIHNDNSYDKNQNEYTTGDIKYNYDGYNRGYNGYNPTNYYNNQQNLKYQLYNMSQFKNNEIAIDNNLTEKPYNLISGYNPNMPLSHNINLTQNPNQVVPGYNGFEDNIYDYSNINNRNSISGVKYQRTDNRWIARWTTAEGKRACKSFSVNIYGFNQAKMLAIQARQKGVALSGRSFCNRERQHAMKSGVGIIGIRFDKTQARWVSSYYEGGKRKFRYFTVKDYGYEQAKRNAIIWKSCNDERLVKRVKEGYGFNYGIQDKFQPNVVYNVNDDNYSVEDNHNIDNFIRNNYIENYNGYSGDFQNPNSFANIPNQPIAESYKHDVNSEFINSNIPSKYDEDYDPKGSMEYHDNYDYSNILNNGPFVDVESMSKYDDIPEIEIGNSKEETNKIWKTEMLKCFKQDNMVEYAKIKCREMDDMTTTTIGSDNHDTKSNGSIDYDEEIETKNGEEGN